MEPALLQREIPDSVAVLHTADCMAAIRISMLCRAQRVASGRGATRGVVAEGGSLRSTAAT
eukprot:3474399-Pleurochrysis_carterae.AAC.1